MSKKYSCGHTHTDVGEIRGCSGCQADGTAARIHAALKDTDPVEAMDPVSAGTALAAPPLAQTPLNNPRPRLSDGQKMKRTPADDRADILKREEDQRVARVKQRDADRVDQEARAASEARIRRARDDAEAKARREEDQRRKSRR